MCYINFLTAHLLKKPPRACFAHGAHVAASDPAPSAAGSDAAGFRGVFVCQPCPGWGAGGGVWVCLGPLCGWKGACSEGSWDVGTKVLLERRCVAGELPRPWRWVGTLPPRALPLMMLKHRRGRCRCPFLCRSWRTAALALADRRDLRPLDAWSGSRLQTGSTWGHRRRGTGRLHAAGGFGSYA